MGGATSMGNGQRHPQMVLRKSILLHSWQCTATILLNPIWRQLCEVWCALRNETCDTCASILSVGDHPLARIPGTAEPNVRIVLYVRVAFLKL